MSFIENVSQGIQMTGIAEWIAVLTGLLYVILAARRSNWCWVFAIVSSGIYVYLCFVAHLYIETILQCFYVGMALLGWYAWSSKKSKLTEETAIPDRQNNIQKITRWPLKYHMINIVLSGAVAFLLGFLFDKYTPQQNPYVDAFTTVFSLTATFMVVRKVLENWIYWIVIDLVSIFLYHQRGYSLSAVLYFLFTIIAVVGFFAWRKKYKTQTA